MVMENQSRRKRLMLIITPDRGGGGGEEESSSPQQCTSLLERLHQPHHHFPREDGALECQCPSGVIFPQSNRISRMPRNSRRRWKTSWRELHLFTSLLLFSLVQLALVGAVGSADVTNSKSMTFSKPMEETGGSRSYSSLDSTTSRSRTSFLPSDAITSGKRLKSSSPTSASLVTKKSKNRNISHFPSSSSSNHNYNHNNHNYVSNNNAILYGSPGADRRSSKSSPGSRHRSKSHRPHRKSKLETTTMSSIDRPFYTKISMKDAVSKPPAYWGRGTTKKPKKGSRSKYSSGSASASTSSSEKYSKTRSKSKSSRHKHRKSKAPKPTPVQPHYEYNEDGMDYLGEDYPGLIMPHTTEKSYHPPKLSLEPFFNFLTSLATASREVIMSKEQYNGHQPTPGTTEGPVSDDEKKSEEDEEDEVELEGVQKPPIKNGRGSKERQKSSEESQPENDAEPVEEFGQPLERPVPSFPLPNNIGRDEQVENEDDGDAVTPVQHPGGLHILDVLRTPMIADYGSTSSTTTTTTSTPAPPLPPPRPPPPSRAEPFRASPLDDIINKPIIKSPVTAMSRPPSGRSNFIKDLTAPAAPGSVQSQGWNPTGGSIPPETREKQQRSELSPSEPDAMESFSDHQAQESISRPQMVPPPSPSFDLQTNEDESPSQNNNLSTTSEGKNDGVSQDAVSKYPASFVYHQPPGGGQMPPGSRLYVSPPSPFGPPASPFRMNKLRPNLQSYYDPNYHHFTGSAEGQHVVASEMIGMRHPYGPPHFTPPPHHPHHRILPSGGPPPPNRFMNHPPYHHRPGPGGFMNMLMSPHRGSHYVGHQEQLKPASTPFANEQSQSGPTSSADYDPDVTGGIANNDNGAEPSSPSSDVTGSSSDNLAESYVTDDNSIITGEHSETKKIGIMESFDLFYKEYKIMTWVAVFFVTSLALLTLLAYLYVNNPPTEVVQARQLFQWGDYLLKNNPQIVKFLSSLKRSSDLSPTSIQLHREEPYLKPLGKGFGAKSSRQKRKQTRSQLDKDKQDKQRRRNISVATSSTKPILISRKRSRNNGTSITHITSKKVTKTG